MVIYALMVNFGDGNCLDSLFMEKDNADEHAKRANEALGMDYYFVKEYEVIE